MNDQRHRGWGTRAPKGLALENTSDRRGRLKVTELLATRRPGIRRRGGGVGGITPFGMNKASVVRMTSQRQVGSPYEAEGGRGEGGAREQERNLGGRRPHLGKRINWLKVRARVG